MKKASSADVPQLVALMAEFYAEAAFPLNHARAADAFTALLADERFGHVWLIQADTRDVGYVVVTLSYSMEYGGASACIDDLFIQPAHRNLGLGTAALAEVRELCRQRGIRSIHLEVARDNAPAQTVYRRAGFVSTDRQLLTLQLADPTHIE
ncbi:MAG: GNAT family N-acetyltransferase [Gemmatimonadota bacterium]